MLAHPLYVQNSHIFCYRRYGPDMEASLQENGRSRELPSRAVPTATEESTVWNPDNVLAKDNGAEPLLQQ